MQRIWCCRYCGNILSWILQMLRATGKPYHPACFNCVVCGKNLDGTTFTVDATNQIHCIDDFHRSVLILTCSSCCFAFSSASMLNGRFNKFKDKNCEMLQSLISNRKISANYGAYFPSPITSPCTVHMIISDCVVGARQ